MDQQTKLKALSMVRREEEVKADALREEAHQQFRTAGTQAGQATLKASIQAQSNADKLHEIGADSEQTTMHNIGNTIGTVGAPLAGSLVHALATRTGVFSG